MRSPRFSFSPTQIRFHASPTATPSAPRDIADSIGDLTALSQRYTELAATGAARRKQEQAIGYELYQWLNGEQGWLGRLVENGLANSAQLLVEFQSDNVDSPVFSAPWELLHNGNEFLSANPELKFTAIRVFRDLAEPPAPSDERLGLVFMAGAPESVSQLAYEQEEAAIVQATGNIGLDLHVEESGNIIHLGESVAALRPDVVHISCHGNAEGDKPVLMLETETGMPEAVDASQLSQELSLQPPKLLFLSACQTAQGTLDSLAGQMLRAGIPAVLAWSGSVLDSQASFFAAELYKALARGVSVESAIAQARLQLFQLDSDKAAGRNDWHLARLYVKGAAGGVLCSVTNKRSGRQEQAAFQAFLDTNKEVPVAGRFNFVGRRRQLQASLRAMQQPKAGVLLQAMGGQGKSSLAARIALRLPQHKAIVLYGRYDENALLTALERDISQPDVKAALLASDGQPLQLRLERLLIAAEQHAAPLLVIVDDFEQVLQSQSSARHLVAKQDKQGNPTGAPECISILLRAFRSQAADSESRLLFTSRFAFTLPADGADLANELRTISVPPMKAGEASQQALLQGESSKMESDAQKRCIAAAKGNPGLQSWLFKLAGEDQDQLAEVLTAMETYLAGKQGTEDSQQVIDYLEQLAIDSLLALCSQGERALLDSMQVFKLPMPAVVLSVLEQAGNISHGQHQRLLDLGLIDQYPDPALGSGDAAYALHPLVLPKLSPLGESDSADIAALCAGPLWQHWGREQRPAIVEWQLALLACHAPTEQQQDILSACAETALRVAEQSDHYRDIVQIGESSIHNGHCAINILRRTGTAQQLLGNTPRARELYQQASNRLDSGAETLSLDAKAALLRAKAALAKQDGDIEQALETLEALATELEPHIPNDLTLSRTHAIALGDIARIHVSKGNVDHALELYHEMIDVFEKLGDLRSRAVTLGDIAHIHVSKGNVDYALELHHERIDVFEKLGDLRERAITLGGIARIHVYKGNIDYALELLHEELTVYEKLGDLRSRAVTLGEVARIHVNKGNVEQALELFKEKLSIADQLGDMRSRAVTLSDIAQIVQATEPAKAETLYQEIAELSKQLGQPDGQLFADMQLAELALQRGDVEAALPLAINARKLAKDLGHVVYIAQTSMLLAQIIGGAQPDQGIELVEHAKAAWQKVGQEQMIQHCDDMLAQLAEIQAGK